MQSTVRMAAHLARPIRVSCTPSFKVGRLFSSSRPFLQPTRDVPKKPAQAHGQGVGSGTLLAAVGVALVVGFGISNYTTNITPTIPIEILEDRRILKPKYATLSEMKKVSDKHTKVARFWKTPLC